MNARAVFVPLLIGLVLQFDRAHARSDHHPWAPEDRVCSDRGLASRDVLLCEDFEDGTFLQRWDVGSNAGTWPNADFVRCGDGFGFLSRCGAWSNLLLFDTSWGHWGFDAWHPFAPQSEFYVRWFQQVSETYEWGPLEDKSLMLHDPPLASMTAYVGSSRNHLPTERHSGPGMPFIANYQDLDWPETGGQFEKINRFQNQGRDITLQPGVWYVFEWYLRMNTPGRSDGVTQLWIDEAMGGSSRRTLRLAYDDMRWLRGQDAGKQFGFVRLTAYRQRCDMTPEQCPPAGPAILNQSQHWDGIIVSRKRIRPAHSFHHQ
jgi:hypothetical protein